MRPVVWGLILTVLGFIYWTAVGAYPSIPEPTWSIMQALAAALSFLSLPASIVVEIYQWMRGRKKRGARPPID